MPSQYVDFPEPGGPITSCANGMFDIQEWSGKLIEVYIPQRKLLLLDDVSSRGKTGAKIPLL
jgi:hypothetical protein